MKINKNEKNVTENKINNIGKIKMPLIIIVTIIAFVVLIIWTCHNLEDSQIQKKIIFIAVGVIISYIITLIIFNISKDGVQYKNYGSEVAVQNMLVAVVTSVIIVPYSAKIYKKLKNKEIKKYQFQRKTLLIAIIIVVFTILECGYLKETQQGILKIYESTAEERK